MKKFVALGAIIAVAASASAAFAVSQATVWTAALSSSQEIPKQVVKDAAAHGLFKGTLTGSTLKWKLTFAKLTGQATAAHIHLGAMGKSGNVVVPLCGPCKSGQSGSATLTAALKADFNKHLLYVNVHTAKNAGGEIRGQLAAG
ncbi:MAG TPA: CHRD domain-containing protein [Gaiellaceae bacterium]